MRFHNNSNEVTRFSDMEDDVDIIALTIEQYIALIPDDIKPSILNPKISDDVEFEINTNFMRELRRKRFTGTDDEDAYEHVRTILEIVDLFHFPGFTQDAIMLRKVHIFYTRLDIPTRKILDYNGFIPLMTPTQALESIQAMANHSHNWYDETTTRERINDDLDNVDAIHEREKVKEITTIGKENMKDSIPHDLLPTPFLGHLKEQIGSPYKTHKTIHMIGNPEEIHNEKAQEDERDMDVGWDITSKDVERLRQFLTPTIHTLPNLEPVVPPCIPLGLVHDMDKILIEKEQDYDIPLNDSIVQPLTPQTIHITQPDDDYVALATNPMSNKQLNKFKEEFSHITEVVKKEYDNPVIKTYDMKEGGKGGKERKEWKGEEEWERKDREAERNTVTKHPSKIQEGERRKKRERRKKEGKRRESRRKEEREEKRREKKKKEKILCSIPINRGLIQAIPISLPPQPIGEATKASNL
ncbi:hypothetical protein Tco_0616177 [Tanacetum coccineum]